MRIILVILIDLLLYFPLYFLLNFAVVKITNFLANTNGDDIIISLPFFILNILITPALLIKPSQIALDSKLKSSLKYIKMTIWFFGGLLSYLLCSLMIIWLLVIILI